MGAIFDRLVGAARAVTGEDRGGPHHRDEGAAAPTGKVLFVCTANVCRSPMAESLFNALAGDKGVPFEASSAGVRALERRPMAPDAVAVLEEIGVYPKPHRARQVSREMLEASDLVLAMSPQHVDALRRLTDDHEKVYTLPGYVTGASGADGIADPYGSPLIAYRACVRQLSELVDLLTDRLGSVDRRGR